MTADRVFRGSATLNVLAVLDDHTLVSPKGGCGPAMATELGVAKTAANSAIAMNNKRGFLEAETRGRRTYRVWITEAGREYVRRHADKVTWAPLRPSTNGNGHVVELTDEQLDALTRPETEREKVEAGLRSLLNDDEVPVVVHDEGRPGRAAARLEKSMPDIVAKAVEDALNAALASFAARLGLTDPAPYQERITALGASLVELREDYDAALETLRFEKAAGEAARAQLNAVLAKSDDGKARNNESRLKPSDLDASWRELAGEFLAQGGTLARTRGGHVLWRWPDGRKAFGPSTSSDWRAVKNMRSDLRRVTGFRDGKGAEA